jgi:hypothetical protein
MESRRRGLALAVFTPLRFYGEGELLIHWILVCVIISAD